MKIAILILLTAITLSAQTNESNPPVETYKTLLEDALINISETDIEAVKNAQIDGLREFVNQAPATRERVIALHILDVVDRAAAQAEKIDEKINSISDAPVSYTGQTDDAYNKKQVEFKREGYRKQWQSQIVASRKEFFTFWKQLSDDPLPQALTDKIQQRRAEIAIENRSKTIWFVITSIESDGVIAIMDTNDYVGKRIYIPGIKNVAQDQRYYASAYRDGITNVDGYQTLEKWIITSDLKQTN